MALPDFIFATTVLAQTTIQYGLHYKNDCLRSSLSRAEMQTQASAGEQRRADGADRRAPDVVTLVRQVLEGCEQLDVAAKPARCEQVEREVTIQLQLILIIIKLCADGAALRSMEIIAGFFSISRDSCTIGGGIVAEKKSV